MTGGPEQIAPLLPVIATCWGGSTFTDWPHETLHPFELVTVNVYTSSVEADVQRVVSPLLQ
jgi:hypothetical protein